MKIAFVGKGGSGKTTLSALFIQYLRQHKQRVVAIDADINMHLAPLLGYGELVDSTLYLSNPENIRDIKTTLKGSNPRIKELAHFRKSTPPGHGSQLIDLSNAADPLLSRYAIGQAEAPLLTVGSYGTEGIGVSCYHNNLAILENMLSHMRDGNTIVVTDMVAGTDAFASTLHAQFDLLVLSVEPTKRGIEVFKQYQQLSEEAGVIDRLRVVGNKARSHEDAQFIRDHIPAPFLLGTILESAHLREIERTGEAIAIEQVEDDTCRLMATIADELKAHRIDADTRLQTLHALHRKYVGQDFITERFGDLTSQIDPDFSYAEAHA
jgi:CO dehydrogenase maturation factor